MDDAAYYVAACDVVECGMDSLILVKLCPSTLWPVARILIRLRFLGRKLDLTETERSRQPTGFRQLRRGPRLLIRY